MTCLEITKNGAITLKSWLTNFKKSLFNSRTDWNLTPPQSDLWLFMTIVGLVIFGLIMVYSSSYIYAQERTGDGFAFIKKQVLYTIVGFGALYFSSRINYKNWLRWAYPILGITLVLLVLVKVPGIGVKVGGAARWVRMGFFNFQPSELAKFALILFAARQLSIKRFKTHEFVAGVMSPLLVPLPFMLLLLSQPDFGSVAIISVVIFMMMFLAGVKLRFLSAFVGGAGLIAVGLISSSPYRLARLLAFTDPWSDPSGKGFQIIQSLIGINNGSLLGVGLGNGKEKLFFLPEAHNDFIFSVIGEELGFIGILLVILIFCFLVVRGFKISWGVFKKTDDAFALFLGSGLTFMLGFQAFVNMCVAIGLLPTKGLSLPFISYGGSALIINLFCVGVLLNISQSLSHAPKSK